MSEESIAYKDLFKKSAEMGTTCARQIETDVYNGHSWDDQYELEACYITVDFNKKMAQGLFKGQEDIPLDLVRSEVLDLSDHPAAQTVYERLVGKL